LIDLAKQPIHNYILHAIV